MVDIAKERDKNSGYFKVIRTIEMTGQKNLLIQTNAVWNGKKLAPVRLENPEINVVRITLPVGERLPMHKHPMINVACVLKGELTVHTEAGESKTFRAGEPVVEVINVWHYGENTGNEPVEMIVTYVGEAGATLAENK